MSPFDPMTGSARANPAVFDPAAARMRSLLLSWVLLAAIWIPGVALVELLVVHRIAFTASAVWTAMLVPACQALALESLAAPLGLAAALARLRRSLRAPRTYLPWSLALASLGAAWFGAGSGGGGVLSAAAAILASAAAALFATAARASGALATARGAALALALLLLLASASGLAPWLDWLDRLPALVAPDWPPRATRLLFLLPWLGAFFAALFGVQRALLASRPAAADWLGAAAGTAALAVVARLLPLRLDVAPQATASLAPGTFFVLVTACLVAAGTSLARGEAQG